MNLLSYPLVQCMICAFGFGFWPVAQKLFGLPLGWSMVTLTLMQLPAVCVLARFVPASAPAVSSLALFMVFGALPNSIAIVSYGYLLSGKGDIITRWLPVMSVMMPIVALCGGAFLLGEALTMRKLCGIAAACYSIYLLSTT